MNAAYRQVTCPTKHARSLRNMKMRQAVDKYQYLVALVRELLS